jgi:large subunit ribosomal protein L10
MPTEWYCCLKKRSMLRIISLAVKWQDRQLEVQVVLKLEDKKTIVMEVAAVAKQASSLIAAEYSGLTVAQLTALRKSAREGGVDMRVVRNTLARRALEGTGFACMQEKLVGPLILAFSKEHPGAAARIMKDFVKQNEKLKVMALALENQLLPAESLNSLASLPTRDEAIAQLMSVMKAPITKFVRTTAEPLAKLVRTIAAIRDAKQSAA